MANIINIANNDTKNLLIQVGKLFFDEKERIYVVGGALRDIILNKTINDLDFVTSASPGRIRKIVKPIARNVYDKSPAKGYGTQGVILKYGLEIEITPFRKTTLKEYHTEDSDTELISNVTLEEDLQSRDFTINAMAANITGDSFGELVDLFDGMGDLEKRRLRTPRRARETFLDDPLRVLRAARFLIEFGLSVDDEIPAAIEYIISGGFMDRTALERIREELIKLIMQKQPSRGIRLLMEWGVMQYLLPEVVALAELEPEPGAHHKDVFEHTMNVLDNMSEYDNIDAVMLFASLLHDIGKPPVRKLEDGGYSFHEHEKKGAEFAFDICKRLRFSSEETERVVQIVRHHHRLSSYKKEWTDSAVRRVLNELGERYEEILALTRADLTTSIPEKREEADSRLDDFLKRLSGFEIEEVLNPKPPIDGNEVMRLLNITPGTSGGGKDVGSAIKYLKELVVSGDLSSDDAESARMIVTERKWENKG